jgi:hypothetical protein
MFERGASASLSLFSGSDDGEAPQSRPVRRFASHIPSLRYAIHPQLQRVPGTTIVDLTDWAPARVRTLLRPRSSAFSLAVHPNT